MPVAPTPKRRGPRRLIVIALLVGSWIVSARHADDVRPALGRHRGPMAAAGVAGDEQRGTPPPAQAQGADARVPRDLRPDQYFRGTPWRGTPGVTERVTDLMAREARQPRVRPLRVGRELDGPKNPRRENPDAPSVSRWPQANAALAGVPSFGPMNPQTVSTSWTGVHASESGAVPPDAIGAVGPTQVMVLANGIFKVFDKAGTLGNLNVSDSTFFASVRGSYGVSDPHIRYDRLSGRWFITEINVANNSNRVLMAVSSGSTITDSSSFTFFQFQHDAVTPAGDTGGFADYDTLGVDANALYIGVNEFTSGTGSFSGTTGYVVNKANLLAGTLTVTAFRGLAAGSSGAGPYTPQGVDNDDPSATEGYFIGVDNATFSTLMVRRIVTPGGTPSISGNISLTVPTTYYPIFGQVAQGTTKTLDAIDDRLFAAMIRKNTVTGVSSLWTAHNICVNSSGASSVSGDRNAMRWYQINSLTSTPVLTQSGTLFDASASNPRGYWMGSVAANGQGHMALVASFAGAADYAGVAVSGRLAGDTLGATQAPSVVVTGAGPYVDWTGYGASSQPQRWGDYSQVVVDPTDNQTMWAFADYAYGTSTTDAWGVRAVKLLAPPPATPTSASPSSVAAGVSSTSVTITGTSSSGSGFFDPGSDPAGPGFTNRLTASVSGGVTVNSVTFTNATTVTLNISTVGASGGAKNVTITNPDGQQATGTLVFCIGGCYPTVTSVSPSSGWTGGGTAVTITGTNFIVGATTVTIGGSAATGVTVAGTTSLTALTPAHAAGAATVSVTTVNGTGSLASGFTYFVSLFTDDPLQAGITPIKAAHITELRTYVNTLRIRYGLAAVVWIDPTLGAGTTTIKAVHLTELRTALSAAYVAANLTAPTYTGTITAGITTITAAQIVEIRNAILAIY